jgi:hypothetical protein
MPGPQHDLFAAYLAELSKNAERMRDTREGPQYTHHLGAAASMAAALESSDLPELQRLIAEERRYYGWSFLPGPEGTRTEAAFASFAEAVQPSR